MDEIELGVLEACQEYVTRQHEMLPRLAAVLGVEESQVFYTWALRRCAQVGKLPETDWVYFFHGLECDLKNQKDGRFLRVDFGPQGRVGILNDWGILRLIMTSVPPWTEFPALRTYFAKSGVPFDEYSGDWAKMLPIWHRLESRGFFEQAAPALVGLQANYTTGEPGGMTYLRFPPEFTDETRADCSVAHRLQLSQSAVRLLKTRSLDAPLRVEPSVGRELNDGQAHTALTK